MSHLSENTEIFFVPADNGILEPWRYNSVSGYSGDHLFAVSYTHLTLPTTPYV